jgi:acyl carrier protein
MSNEDTVYNILMKLTGKDRSEITPETDLTSGLGIDSPMADIEISDEEAAPMETVGDVLKQVNG